MNPLTFLERRLNRFAIPNITLVIILCQVIVYILITAAQSTNNQRFDVDALLLIPNLVLQGEVWRLVTFIIVPPFINPICAFFSWYLFYLMGTALEHNWGVCRYNIYLFIGYIANIAVSFITPNMISSNGYLEGSVFLAFAFLFPEFELYLLFLFPVKIKWLALLTWIAFVITLIFGDWMSRWLVCGSVCNFLLFFGKDIIFKLRSGQRRMALQAAYYAIPEKDYYHKCTTCGITDRTHPQMDFRYCSKCDGAFGYCSDHLKSHEHVVSPEEPAK